ncbi:curli assembly protein CsgF [Joostella atrarenae]|uniref:Curli production assembly/transport component CsgF n=1 Tax=Joostella atrarenae TaxID=679257 RepID=A0ABS9J3E9_9FLAO|nr:curli production assembly/transport component CsgF [Joostella atrarenae]MCF8714952.1 curli assembly protein CsgF [Joostella atrarenae]
MKLLINLLLLLTFTGLSAQSLVYTPKNPNFGGQTFNYQWLLSSAQAQNSFTDPNATDYEQGSSLDSFKESLNSQLLSQITRNLFSEQFGDGALEEGSYALEGLAVDIYPSEDGLVIDILDTDTGEQTQVVIPNQ